MLTTGGVFVTVIDVTAVLVDPSASVIDAVIVCVPFDRRLVASAAADRAVRWTSRRSSCSGSP